MFRWSIINLFICFFNQANGSASCWLISALKLWIVLSIFC
ncbi:Hypothetical protein P9303_07231 [Prochlorococcus marinus str. MIT 9303]|uniref:Uncharacterized protein n=1 Tax=Prochlorococcus marinus (strain MIT 9303) TaxID=59922 RepID=A2C7L4_PROM3|nr:Hypothetical protein P9303_07231 [Prochlorococcus marinus str. MIT 9303]